MLKKYLLSRQNIIVFIGTGEKTDKGNIWCPKIGDLMDLEGKELDDKYFYNREYFKYKMYFTEEEKEAFLSDKKIDNFDIEEMYDVSIRFYNANKELKCETDIRTKVYPFDFTINELIDSFIDLYEYIK